MARKPEERTRTIKVRCIVRPVDLRTMYKAPKHSRAMSEREREGIFRDSVEKTVVNEDALNVIRFPKRSI